MRATLRSLLLAACLSPGLTPGTAAGQPAVTRPAPPLRPTPVRPAGEIVIYRDRNFSGPAVRIAQDEPDLGLVWRVNSARVDRGAWQLCDRPHFRGSCVTLRATSHDLRQLRVESARAIGPGAPPMGWRTLGDAEINRLIRDRRVIEVHARPTTDALRLCAENAPIRLFEARARFTNGLTQALHLPSRVERGACTDPLLLTGPRRQLASVEVIASSQGLVRGRLRLEAR